MADDAPRVLVCLVEGDSSIFPVTPTGDMHIWDLQKLIKEEKKNGVLNGVDSSDLILWKVNLDIPSKKEDRKRLTGKSVPDSMELDNGIENVSDHWPATTNPKTLQIIVELPSDIRPEKRRRSDMDLDLPGRPATGSSRSNTVSTLYERLKKYRLIQVRGTPASGKTILSFLLVHYIRDQEPNADVRFFNMWPLKNAQPAYGYNYNLKLAGWSPDRDTIFIFDNAELTYDDEDLWTGFFKNIHDFPNRRAILFSSYGSPGRRIIRRGTPFHVKDEQMVTLRAVQHQDDLPAAGLLFSRVEFDDLISKDYPDSMYHFDSSFFDFVFDITGGHVGAVKDFLLAIIGHNSYRTLKYLSGRRYDYRLFMEQVGIREILDTLASSASIFLRGLPGNSDLQNLATAGVFSAVLCNNVVNIDDDIDQDALQLCYRKGWLHADKIGLGEPKDIGYVFASPFHRWYVEWSLFDNVPAVPFEANNILDFVIDVIRNFKPQLLSAERRIGPGYVQRPPEAQYQDEFYRSCHKCSKGSLKTFPEFGTAKGRVDFYIPAKKWGVELLRDGDRLGDHSGRFTSGAYRGLPLDKYVILDCSDTRPKIRHPKFKNLYHVVFSNNFQDVCILNNVLNVVDEGEFRLLSR